MEKLRENVYLLHMDSVEEISCAGKYCFIIGFHLYDLTKISLIISKMLDVGVRYFCVFGRHANLWKEIITKMAGKDISVKIEASTVANQELAYNLAMYSSLDPQSNCLVLSDDYAFMNYIAEDLEDIIEQRMPFSVSDWKKFRDGFEFEFFEKDAVVSVSEGVVLGFLGEEEYFDSIFKAFYAKVFDGYSFYEVWDKISRKI